MALNFYEKYVKAVGQFMKATGLGVEVTYAPNAKPSKKIRGVFQNPNTDVAYGVVQYETNKPMLTVQTADVDGIKRTVDTFIIDVLGTDTTYKVHSIDHTLVGMTTLELTKA